MTHVAHFIDPVILGASAIALAIIISVGVLAWPLNRLPRERRLHGVGPEPSLLTQATATATGAIGKAMARRSEDARGLAVALERAGVRWTVPDLILIVGAALLTGLAVGLVVGGPLLGVVFAGLAPAGAYTFISLRIRTRQSSFADQLDDILQLLAGNLRAGHSLLQALDSLTREIEEPAAAELTRVVNEVRVGRDLGEALYQSAARMNSEDFRWVAQAIAIHRQVGGNLADVLDQVGRTIRERNKLRRQVRALSAEGKLSAWVLGGMPVLVIIAMSVFNPEYIGRLTQSVLGFLIIGISTVLMTVGILVLRKMVKVEF